jgi:Rps23 Pro-64 3,4-dihydroxylase Tpa1-like proline 4-hydroxylase
MTFRLSDFVPLNDYNSPAYIDINVSNEETKWIAIVENNDEIEVIFTAIDNCIKINRKDGKMNSRCDGMIIYQNHIIFVELKERSYRNSVWIEEAEQQLKNIIYLFLENNNIANYQSKKAYIANRKKPDYQFSRKEIMQKFRNETGFILLIQNIIKI